MPQLHRAIVLRTASVSRPHLILLDETLGKIEGIISPSKIIPSHGAIISYTLQKRGMKYLLADLRLVDMPLYWARENLLFFHHVLELCDYFIQWGEHADVFPVLHVLYTSPEALESADAKKLFLRHFFKMLGMEPECDEERIEVWMRACLNEHPRAAQLQTTDFLKTVELNEEFA